MANTQANTASLESLDKEQMKTVSVNKNSWKIRIEKISWTNWLNL